MSANQAAPLDVTRLQKLASQLGSNPGGIYQTEDGQRFYVKMLESVAHARNEFIAAQLYQLAGAPCLTYLVTTAADQIATRWVELDKRCVAHLDQNERAQAQQWFGVHAWTANWDAAGFHGDNQGVAAGTVLTLDVGGALSFRAQGDPKGKAFGPHVMELERLRNDPDNPHCCALFAQMSPAQLARAIDVVVSIPDTDIRATIRAHQGSEKLVEKMIARKADMASYLERLAVEPC